MRYVLGIIVLALSTTPALAGPAPRLTVTSSAFSAGGAIPDDYTCAGSDESPQLAWTNPPASTKSVAVLVEDPDASGAVHWLITGLDPVMTGLPKAATLPDGAAISKNAGGRAGYMGPCPPAGALHHYHFEVFALDTTIAKPETKAAFMTAIEGHVVSRGELIGTYRKK